MGGIHKSSHKVNIPKCKSQLSYCEGFQEASLDRGTQEIRKRCSNTHPLFKALWKVQNRQVLHARLSQLEYFQVLSLYKAYFKNEELQVHPSLQRCKTMPFLQ